MFSSRGIQTEIDLPSRGGSVAYNEGQQGDNIE